MLWKAHLNWEAPHVFGPQARPSGFCLHSSVRRTETRVSSSGCPYRRRKQACSPSFVSWSSLKRRLLGIAWPTLRVVTAVLTIRIACPADCVGLVSGVRPKGERTSALLASKEDYRETWPLALMLILPEGLLFLVCGASVHSFVLPRQSRTRLRSVGVKLVYPTDRSLGSDVVLLSTYDL